MKKVLIVSMLTACVSLLQAQQLTSYSDSVSYAVGVLWGQNIKQQGLVDLNPEVLAKAISSVLDGEETLLDMRAASQMIKEHMNREKALMGKKNLAEGKEFLATNAEREGVITLPSGLQYEILTEGQGPLPTTSDKVRVHYEGTLINGDVFDSSYQRGEPITFPVTGVIQGWVEALQLMKVGSKWKLYIPSDLAYGPDGAGGKIGPNATLIFEVELLGIE